MAEKTLRYPGHIDLVRALRESGFLSQELITVGGGQVRPIDVTAALLFQQWRLGRGEPEFTVMEITVRGPEGETPREYVYRLLDHTDERTGTSSMARTTGYTCTATARLVLEGRFARAGICPPEYVGADETCFEYVLADLAARGVQVDAVRVEDRSAGGGDDCFNRVQSSTGSHHRSSDQFFTLDEK